MNSVELDDVLLSEEEICSYSSAYYCGNAVHYVREGMRIAMTLVRDKIKDKKMITIEQVLVKEKADEAFDDFKRCMKKEIGSQFSRKDEPIFRSIFVNGYMKAIGDLAKMSRS